MHKAWRFFYGPKHMTINKNTTQRAYSFISVKSVDEGQRVIRGMATTPDPDRMGDIVEPKGASYRNPLPLLWMHDHRQPVGTVTFGKATDEGIPFEAKIAAIPEPAQLKARCDEAWASVKSGLIGAVSIGFRAVEWAIIESTGGVRFSKTDIFELSLVTVPANPNATIQQVKSMDSAYRAALGTDKVADEEAARTTQAVQNKQVTITPKKVNQMTLAEQIKQFQAERGAKAAALMELTKKSEGGTTLDDADGEAFDTLNQEIATIDKQLSRLEVAQSLQSAAATPVPAAAGAEPAAAVAARKGIQVVTQKQEPGIGLARMVRCIGLAQGNKMQAVEIAKAAYAEQPAIANLITKLAVPAGTTLDTTWAKPLVGEESSIFADFVNFLRPQTIIGKFGSNGIPALRQVPFRTGLISQTTGGAGYWVGEGKAKPVTKFDFTRTHLNPLKVANIAVITEELLRDSSPSAEIIVRDELVNALRARMDLDFIDPLKSAVSNVSPASITNGVSAIPSSGSDADAVRCDLKALWSTFLAANNAATTGVYIMNSVTALALSLMTNALGQAEFPDLTPQGGMLKGVPVITSEYVATASDGTSYIVLVNAQDIWFADEGGFNVDMSREASLQMLDNPTNDATGATAPTSLVSLWQTDCVGFRAERTINWAKRRASAVALVSGVNYGNCDS